MTLCSGPELKYFSEMQTGIAGVLGTQCWDAKPRPLRNPYLLHERLHLYSVWQRREAQQFLNHHLLISEL